jgi:MoaA/NifB/PqqE/SkfB family radical SAM enzyme
MFWQELNSLWKKKRDWIQVEVTSWCNAGCIYCPRTVYQNRWKSRHLPISTIQRLLPAFARASLVFLQGWGEPFLHPDFFSMASMAKRAGCMVGTTTNGMLLDADKLLQLVRMGIDLVAFSLAGVDEKNDAVRRGTSLKKVLEAIQALNRLKEEMGSDTPAIHLAYMLLSSGLKDLDKLPAMLQGSGVSQVVINTLDFVASKDLELEAIRPRDIREYEDMHSQLEELVRLGKRHGFIIHHQLKNFEKRRLTCTENVQQALVVSADGQVSPCVFTNLPVSEVNFVKNNLEYLYSPLFFGNVNERSLESVWGEKPYKTFRRSFYTGKLAPSCRLCSKLV